ncbi:MAG: lactonase family protein [Pseudomonadota bacterium]
MAVRAYVGCRSTAARQARGRGIAVYRMPAQGPWVLEQVLETPDNPSFLLLRPAGRVLYTVHGDGAQVSACAVDPASGALTLRGSWPCGGRNPVHLALSPQGRWLVIANYATGNVTSLPVDAEGMLGAVASSLAFPGNPGPLREHQTGSHPHQAVFDPSGRWLLVPDKGLDRVFTLVLDEKTGQLSLAAQALFPPGSGPRHLVFHPDRLRLFVAGELDCSVHACRFDPRTGVLLTEQSLPTVPPDASAGSSAAGIVLSQDGRRLYVSNRGHGSVAHFACATGVGLHPEGWSSSGGRTPRFITLAPGGATVVALNEDTDSIVALGSAQVRAPQAPYILAFTGSPVCAVFTEGSTP